LPTGLALPGFPPLQWAGDVDNVPIALIEQLLGLYHSSQLVV
jgi:hypothetical protein